MPTTDHAISTLLHAFRAYVTDGVPSSGKCSPSKLEIRAGLTDLGTALVDLEQRVTGIENALSS